MKRYPGLTDLPCAREQANLSDEQVRAWGRKVGEAMKAVGLNMNLAPVLDVAESGHMADNRRSFSGDAEVVAKKARAYSEGLLAAGVIPIGKHFPGYGNLAGDSDHELATAPWDKTTILEQVQVFNVAKDVLGGVMMSNVVYPAYDTKPAILAGTLVSMAHERDWLTVTDDIAIRALADSIGGTEEDVLRAALMAGNDLLLTTAPPDWEKGIDYIGLLTRFGEESPAAKARIDAACTRLLRLKDRMGLLDGL
jgi:beta-N-acetylhexosaminidase